MSQERADFLTLILHFKQFFIEVKIAPEDWDKILNAGFAYIDETNQERAAFLSKCY